ncbi:MAG: hypothetical protein GEV06_20285 [Luteitalea sp.]|nr:hypothetical protein [Luteitalea sp.]
MPAQNMRIRAEQLGYWYLRLNGFLTIPNFIVHPEQGRNQETDVDILAVRFPYRAELRTMQDDQPFTRISGKSFIALAEIKSKVCALNGPWTNPDRQNMHKVLRAVGAFPAAENEIAAAALYERGFYQSQLYHTSLLCLGEEESPEVATNYPKMPQMTWFKALSFIYTRFDSYRRQKESHGQWDEQGRALWVVSEQSRSSQEFVDRVGVVG